MSKLSPQDAEDAENFLNYNALNSFSAPSPLTCSIKAFSFGAKMRKMLKRVLSFLRFLRLFVATFS